MLFYILLSVIFGIGIYSIYSRFFRKEDTWSGTPIDDISSSVDHLEDYVHPWNPDGTGNYRPTEITEENTPKGVDFDGDVDFIQK